MFCSKRTLKMSVNNIILIFFILHLSVIQGKDIECDPDKDMLYVNATVNERGNLYSPGFKFGNLHPEGIRCTTRITVPENMHIRLKFNTVDLVPNLLCQEDQLVVMNVNATNFLTPVGVYCGSPSVRDLVSDTNRIQIYLQTGFFGAGKGFNISYTVTSSPSVCADQEFECRNRKCLAIKDLQCDGEDNCGDGSDEEYCGWSVLPGSDCGVPPVRPVVGNFSGLWDRIVGGREALRGSWPWQVDLQDALYQPNGHICGGTLINTEWFVTAAHCLMHHRAPFTIRVHVGNHHKYKSDPYEQIRYIKDYEVFGVKKADFFKTGIFNFSHDIAVVKLNSPVSLNPHVQTACLPHSYEELSVGQKCFSTGWGMTRGSGSDDVLKQAEHIIQNEAKCVNPFVNFENKTMICAGRLDRLNGMCNGDSGGPLVCQRDGKWFVHGVVNFLTEANFMYGICGLANKPTIFHKISSKIDWIATEILNH